MLCWSLDETLKASSLTCTKHRILEGVRKLSINAKRVSEIGEHRAGIGFVAKTEIGTSGISICRDTAFSRRIARNSRAVNATLSSGELLIGALSPTCVFQRMAQHSSGHKKHAKRNEARASTLLNPGFAGYLFGDDRNSLLVNICLDDRAGAIRELRTPDHVVRVIERTRHSAFILFGLKSGELFQCFAGNFCYPLAEQWL